MATTGEPTYPPTGEPTPGAPMGPEVMPPGAPPTEVPMAPPPKRITSGGIIAIVGGLMVLIGTFLPYFDISEYGGPVWLGIQTSIWGILPLIFAILIIVLILLKKPLISGILGIVSLIFVILPLLIIASILATYGVAGFAMSVFSYGWYLALIGSILAMIGGFVGHKQM